MPAERDVEVRMGAGEVRIDDVRDDLYVHLGAGDVEVRSREESIRSVNLRAGVGDARLELDHREVTADRRHLIGAELDWQRGSGEARIEVQVGAGDINVRLD